MRKYKEKNRGLSPRFKWFVVLLRLAYSSSLESNQCPRLSIPNESGGFVSSVQNDLIKIIVSDGRDRDRSVVSATSSKHPQGHYLTRNGSVRKSASVISISINVEYQQAGIYWQRNIR